MHRILFLPDIWPAGYPAYLIAGYRLSGRIFNSTITWLVPVKYEINKDIRCIWGFLFPYLKHTGSIYLHQRSNGFKKTFLRFYDLIPVWLSIKIGRISGYFQYRLSGRRSEKANPVSGRIRDIRKGRIIRPARYPEHAFFNGNQGCGSGLI
jgi:hypothetical protein